MQPGAGQRGASDAAGADVNTNSQESGAMAEGAPRSLHRLAAHPTRPEQDEQGQERRPVSTRVEVADAPDRGRPYQSLPGTRAEPDGRREDNLRLRRNSATDPVPRPSGATPAASHAGGVLAPLPVAHRNRAGRVRAEPLSSATTGSPTRTQEQPLKPTTTPLQPVQLQQHPNGDA